MKKFRKIVAGVLAVSMLLSLMCGCSGSKEDSDTVKLGYIYDMTGENAGFASVVKAPIEMAVEDINENGGVAGKQLEVVEMDGATDVQTYTDLAKKLIYDEGVSAIIMTGNSACREAIRSICEEAKVPLFHTSPYEGGVASDYTVCTGSTPELQILPMLEYIKENNLGSKIYIVGADMNYGQICGEWVKTYAEQLGLEIVGEEYIPLDVTQFGSTINNVLSSDADILSFFLFGQSSLSFYEQWYNAGAEDVFFMGGTTLTNGEQTSIDAKYIENILCCGMYYEGISDSEEAKSFEERYAQKDSKSTMTETVVVSYYTIKLWAAACEAAGSTEGEAVMAAINKDVTVDNGVGGQVTIVGSQHHVATDMYLVQVGENDELNLLKKYEDVQPTYLESLGIDLTKEAPNKQFTPLDDN